jgi:heme exporter protein B
MSAGGAVIWTGWVIVSRDLRLAFRHLSDVANPLVFFIIVVSLFPLGIRPEPETLSLLAPGVIWIAALLATLLSLDSIFRTDFDDGTLEQMFLSARPLAVIVLAKAFAHWIVTGLPLLLLGPLLGLLLALPGTALAALTATLALGTPTLSLIGSIGSGLTVSLKRGGALLSLLVLPLYVPVLIFGANAVDAAANGLPIRGQMLMLAAILALAVTLAPLAAATALRVSTD